MVARGVIFAAALMGVSCTRSRTAPVVANPPDAVASPSPVRGRTAGAGDAGFRAQYEANLWHAAESERVEDLAALARVEGGAGLVDALSDPALRRVALQAMPYADGWDVLPALATEAFDSSDDGRASEALDHVFALGVRPRRSVDLDDREELAEGCATLTKIVQSERFSRARRVGAARALRVVGCSNDRIPEMLDAR